MKKIKSFCVILGCEMKKKLSYGQICILILCFGLLIGCSTENSMQGSGEDASFVTDHADREVGFTEPPRRIVSLVQGDMEIVHKLGAEVVGRPTISSDVISEELRDVPEVGTAHEVDFEKVVSLKPDLVIGSASLNVKDATTAEALGLKMFLTNSNSYDKILDVIEMYGEILDRQKEATALIDEIEETKATVAARPVSEQIKALIIYGTPESFMAALPTSLSGNLLEIAGAENIASQLPGIDNYPDYAQLSMERVIEGNPDVIYFITHGDPEAVKDKFKQELKSNPSWENMTAFEQDQFIFLPYELFGTNPGSRVVESLEYLRESLNSTQTN